MQNCEEAQGSPVLAIYDVFRKDVYQLWKKEYTREGFNKKSKSNVPVWFFRFHLNPRLMTFISVRNREKYQINILLKKFEQPRFYEDEGSDEYCLTIRTFPKLVNQEKLQQDFSILLGSGGRIVDFIFDTLWPLIDENERIIKERAQRKMEIFNQFNRKTVPRELNSRYSFRNRKNDEELDRMKTSREYRYINRCRRV